jgi:type I restriction enzyme S subunit
MRRATTPSGIDWIGNIPTDWTVKRLKFITTFAYGDALAAEARSDGDVAVYGSNGIVGTHDRANTVGETLIIGRKGSYGKINRSPVSAFAIDTTYFVDARFTSVHIDWLYHLLGCLGLDAFSKDSAVPGLAREDAYEKYCPAPPITEQRQIASYIDRETARIDALTAKKRRLLELLEEKRLAVITHAVTKGLDPNAPMKHSGIDWLGQIPAHWNAIRLKHVAKVQSGIAKGARDPLPPSIVVPYLRVANVQDGFLDLDDIAEIEIRTEELDRYRLHPGDVLMNEGGDYDKLGRGTVWRGQIDPCIHQNHVFAVRCERIEPEWLDLITCSSYAKWHFILRSKQTPNLASISSTNVMELPVLVPPSEERASIRAAVQSELRHIDELAKKETRLVALLQEYRSALITSAVTGKIDVRDAAERKEAAE